MFDMKEFEELLGIYQNQTISICMSFHCCTLLFDNFLNVYEPFLPFNALIELIVWLCFSKLSTTCRNIISLQSDLQILAKLYLRIFKKNMFNVKKSCFN